MMMSTPALGADEQPLASIMHPSIMSQMVMLDEAPSSAAAQSDAAPLPSSALVEVARAEPERVIQTMAPPLYNASPVTSNTPQPVAGQMSTIIPQHSDTPLANPPPVREVEAPATSQATPPPDTKEVGLKGSGEYKLEPQKEPRKISDGAMTLEDAIAMAIKNSPERQIAGEQVLQAVSAVDEARSNYFPQVSANAAAGREYNDPYANSAGALNYSGQNYGSSMGVNVRQMLYDGFITRETVKQRMALVDSSKLSRAKVTEELIKSTVEVYMELYQFQQVVAASAENLEALKDIAHLVDLRLKAGDASKAELNYMQARVAAAEQAYISSQAARADAFNALIYLVGEIPEFDATKPVLDPYLHGDPETIMEKAISDNTDVRLVKSDKEAATHDLAAAKGRYMPELDLVVDGSHSDQLGGFTGSRDYAGAKLQVSYKIFDGGLRAATSQRQTAKIREVEARQDRVKRDITQKVSRDYTKQLTTVKELKVAEDEIVANTDLEKLYRKQFKSGDIDITNLVESQERIFGARMKKYKLESDMVNVTFSILRNTSELLPTFCGNTTGC